MVKAVAFERPDCFVGRELERSQLVARLNDARAGRGSLSLIYGEPGIGKTRLLETLADAASSSGVPVFWGRCWESGGAPAYWPWIQVVRSISDAATRDDDRLQRLVTRVGRLDASVIGRARGSAPPSVEGSVQVRADLFDAVALLLETAADGLGAAVVALEDLHAADTPSLLLLRFVARRVSDSRIVIACTYREAEMTASRRRQQILSEIAPLAEILPLAGLGEDGVGALLEHATGDVRVGFSAAQVKAATDGNPLYVKHVAEFLARGGGRGRRLPAPHEMDVVIRRRLSGLDGRSRRVLAAASVLGREFDRPVLVELSDESSSAVLDTLGTAVRLGVLTEVGLQRWSFSHVLLRDSLYASLPPGERMRLHNHAGDLIEAMHGDDLTPWLAALAHHFSEAAPSGDATKAVTYTTRAADAAMVSLAFEEAAVLYERGLELLRRSAPADHARRHDFLMAVAKARQLCGDTREAQVACREALRRARLLGSPEWLAEAACRLARMAWADDIDAALEEARGGLPEKDTALRARILVTLAYARYWERPWEWRAHGDMVRQGAEMAQRVGDRAARLDAILAQGIFMDPRAVDERKVLAEDLLRLSYQVGSFWDLGLARSLRIRTFIDAGEVQAAAAELDVFTREAEKTQSAVLRWAVLRARVSLLLLGGDFGGAEAMAQQTRIIGERWESPDVDWTFGAQLGAIRRQQGRFSDLEELARRATDQAIGVPSRVHCCRVDRALALAERGCGREATAQLRDMVPDGLRPENYGPPRTCCLVGLGDVAWALWDEASAETLFEALLPFAGLHAWESLTFVASAGATDRVLARLATVLRRWKEAETFFKGALQLHDRMGARVFRAHDDHDYGRMLLVRRGPGDESRAFEVLSSARERYRSLGMDFYERRAETLLGELRGRHPRTATSGIISFEGDYWSVDFGGSVVRIRDGKGVRYLFRLLINPGRKIHVLDLVGEVDGRGESEAERARQRVTKAIKGAIERLAEMIPPLGVHIRRSIRTGVHCSYLPDASTPVEWQVRGEMAARL